MKKILITILSLFLTFNIGFAQSDSLEVAKTKSKKWIDELFMFSLAKDVIETRQLISDNVLGDSVENYMTHYDNALFFKSKLDYDFFWDFIGRTNYRVPSSKTFLDTKESFLSDNEVKTSIDFDIVLTPQWQDPAKEDKVKDYKVKITPGNYTNLSFTDEQKAGLNTALNKVLKENPNPESPNMAKVNEAVYDGLKELRVLCKDLKKEVVDLGNVKVYFSKADGNNNKYGYDIMDKEIYSSVGHHISVKEFDETYINIKIEGNKKADNFKFISENSNILLSVPDNAKSEFLLKIKSNGETINKSIKINAIYIDNDKKEFPLGNFFVDVYKEYILEANVYLIKRPNVNNEFLSKDEIELIANSYLQYAVIKLNIVSFNELTIDYDNNKNGKLDKYSNISSTSTENDELSKIYNEVTDKNAIVILGDGFNMSYKVSESINIGDTEINVPSVSGFKKNECYSIRNVDGNLEEYFFVSEIDGLNNILKVILAQNINNRCVPQEINGFKNEYFVSSNPVNSSYIYWFSPGGIASSPIIIGNDCIEIGIPHEMLHRIGYKDVGQNELNMMNCITNCEYIKLPLRYFEIQPVQSGCGLPVGNKQNQWDLLNNLRIK